MCKKTAVNTTRKAIPDSTKVDSNSYNIGLINSTTNNLENMEFPFWEILEIITAIVMILLLIRWIKKFLVRRNMIKDTTKEKRIQEIIKRATDHKSSRQNTERHSTQFELAPLHQEYPPIRQQPNKYPTIQPVTLIHTPDDKTTAIIDSGAASFEPPTYQASCPGPKMQTVGEYDRYRV